MTCSSRPSSATTTIAICNLTDTPISFNYSDNIVTNYYVPNLSGVTINAYESYPIDVIYNPQVTGFSEAYIEVSTIALDLMAMYFRGISVNTLLNFNNTNCFIDFGDVGVADLKTMSKTITNVTDRDVTISFSGNLTNYMIDNPVTLVPGDNTINISINPQKPGDCTEWVVLEGDCNNHLIKLCGFSKQKNSVYITLDNTSSYAGCCSYPKLNIYNNRFGNDNNTITITNIQYPTNLSTDQTYPITILGSSCSVVDFTFCPINTGLTTSTINVEYTYEYSGSTIIGNSEIDFTLFSYPHPFTTIELGCLSFNCSNADTEKVINITNYGDKLFRFYHVFTSNNGYELNDIFKTEPSPYYVIPPFTTTGITVNFDVAVLTTASTFNELFFLNLIDPTCCKEYTKCINVSFCPTTVTPNYGYPMNVTCNGECNGQYAFTVNDCSGNYNISWSSDTKIPFSDEIQYCSIITERGCRISIENGLLPQHTDKISATNLYAGNYLLTLINSCNDISYHTFTITQPDPLYVSINWKNPKNYCKSDIGNLCGIVESPDVNPAGYVVIDKETLVNVINNDLHNIKGQTKRGYQQYELSENQVAQGQKVDPINSFRNYILNFVSGGFANYKTKTKKEEIITIKAWDDIVTETIGKGCCFSSYVSGGTAPYTYQWYGPNGYTSTSPNIFDRPCCEAHTLVITDAHGCTTSATSTCLQCTFGIDVLNTINPTCVYSKDGEISVSVSGNCPDSVYKIELESSYWVESYLTSSHTFSNLPKDNYILRVENIETECKLDPINITLQPKYKFNITSNITGTTCIYNCNGNIEVTPNVIYNENGIDSIFVYQLDGGNFQSETTFSGVCSGNHTINAINVINGCEITENIDVPNLDLFQIGTEVIPATGMRNNDGQIIITVTNGISLCDDSICYEFNNNITQFPNNQLIIKDIIPGTYKFKVSDKNGCHKTFNVVVNYIVVKKQKENLFDSKRTDSYGGSKITSNTPKGQ